MSDSLLPPSSSDLERRLEAAISGALPASIPIESVWNPFTCPLEVLPYLAWALSVDSWSSAWSEDVKRRVVAASIQLHKIKGTRPALESVLSTLGFEGVVEEWFEMSPRGEPATFSVKATVSDRGIDSALYNELERLIYDVKPVRMHLASLDIIGKVSGGANVASSVACGDVTRVYPYIPKSVVVGGVLSNAAAVHVLDTVSVYPA